MSIDPLCGRALFLSLQLRLQIDPSSSYLKRVLLAYILVVCQQIGQAVNSGVEFVISVRCHIDPFGPNVD